MTEKNFCVWDGTCPNSNVKYPFELTGDLLIDDEGTVYYHTREENPKLMIWCPASRLRAHLVHLNQIAARK